MNDLLKEYQRGEDDPTLQTKVMSTYTAQELQEKLKGYGYDVSISTIKKSFAKVFERAYLKYNIKISKQGRGDKTLYTLEYEYGNYDEGKAENQAGLIEAAALNANSLPLAIMVMLATRSEASFSGDLVYLLYNLEMPITRENAMAAKQAIDDLEVSEFIIYAEDKSQINQERDIVNRIFIMRLSVKGETTVVNNRMVHDCRILARNTHRHWTEYMRVWAAARVLISRHPSPYLLQEISVLTGLSKKTSSKVLGSLVDAGFLEKSIMLDIDTSMTENNISGRGLLLRELEKDEPSMTPRYITRRYDSSGS